MKAELIKHKNVEGKEQLYLRLSNEKGYHLINIGEKTYKSIAELLLTEATIKNEKK